MAEVKLFAWHEDEINLNLNISSAEVNLFLMAEG